MAATETARTPPSWPLLGLAVGFVGLVLVGPLLSLVGKVVIDLPGAAEQLLTWDATHALGLSVLSATVALLVNGVLGVLGGIVLVRHRFFGRRALDALVDLPLAVSPVMTGLAFLLLFGRGGWLQPAIEALGFQIAYAWPGVVVATLFVTLPFTIREVALLLEELGEDEERAAATLGASPWQTFWRVTLPNLRHGIAVGSTLTVARGLGEFGAVLVLGGAITSRTETATTFVHAAIEERHVAAAHGMALILGSFAAVFLAILHRHNAKE